ncbi:40408_t:CDS:1, partial [Gigaspora margarita]
MPNIRSWRSRNNRNNFRRMRERRRNNSRVLRIIVLVESLPVYPPEYNQFIEQILFGSP